METLNDTDLDKLTDLENWLIRLRKREAANTNRLCQDISDAVEKVDCLRSLLAGRLGRAIQTIPTEW